MRTNSIHPAAKAAAFAGVSLGLGLLFNLLFFQQFPGISVVVFVAAIVAGLAALAEYLQRPLPKSVLWMLLPLGFFAGMVAVRASYMLILLNIMACLLLLLLIARNTFHDDLRNFKLWDYAKIPFLPFKFVLPLLRTIGDFFASRSAVAKHPLAGQITRGVLLAIPALVIFLALFASADLVFQKFVTDAFKIQISDALIVQIILVAIVTLAFTGAYAYIFGKSEGEMHRPASAPALRIGSVEVSILLGSVGVLFLAFIAVQLTYLFGGQSNISAQGFTYAQYARKGFFELLLVAMVAFGMIWAADRTVKKSDAGHGLAFKILGGVLIAEVILVMVSAFKRLYLYEEAFGFTTLRLFSHVFVVFLAVVFGLLLIKILRNQAENRFALPVFITAMVFLAGMNLLNPDGFIGRQNLDRYSETGKLDGTYMGSLSADAQPEIEKALSITTGQTHQDIQAALDDRFVPTGWQSWNYARWKN